MKTIKLDKNWGYFVIGEIIRLCFIIYRLKKFQIRIYIFKRYLEIQLGKISIIFCILPKEELDNV